MQITCPSCSSIVADASQDCPECGADISRITSDETMISDAPTADPSHSAMETMIGPDSSLDKTVVDGAPAEDVTVCDAGGTENPTMITDEGEHAPQPDDDRNALAGTVVAGRYKMEKELGRGGFAVVYKAFDDNLDKEVAIKRLLPKALEGREGARMRGRFRNEAKAIARLDHPNILRVFDVGEDEAGLYIVMDFINGNTLEDHLAERPDRKLPVEDAVAICRAVAAGLSHAHRKKLIHRDIKPSNIMLSRDGGRIVPKVVDFGLARIPESGEMTQTGMGAGTPNYMPPEQRLDVKNVTHAADIFSLGKVIYVCVTGGDPFTINTALIPPPVKLSEIIIKCVQTLPDKRFYSMEALIAAMDELSDEGGGGAGGDARSDMLNNVCPQCSSPNEKGDRFCAMPGCGAPLTRDCPECEEENSVHRAVCRKCGTDMDAYSQAKQVLADAREMAEKKEWRKVQAQAALAPRDRSFVRGSKGWKLLEEINSLVGDAKSKLVAAGDLKERAESTYAAGNLTHAAQLLDDARDLDPGDSSILGRSDEYRYEALRSSLQSATKEVAKLLAAKNLTSASAGVADIRGMVTGYELPAGAEWEAEFRRLVKGFEAEAKRIDAAGAEFATVLGQATSARDEKRPEAWREAAATAVGLNAESEEAAELLESGQQAVAETASRFQVCSEAAVARDWKAVIPAAESVLAISAEHAEAKRLLMDAQKALRKRKQMMLLGAVAAIVIAFGAVLAVRPTLFKELKYGSTIKEQLAVMDPTSDLQAQAAVLAELTALARELPAGNASRQSVKEREGQFAAQLGRALTAIREKAAKAGVAGDKTLTAETVTAMAAGAEAVNWPQVAGDVAGEISQLENELREVRQQADAQHETLTSVKAEVEAEPLTARLTELLKTAADQLAAGELVLAMATHGGALMALDAAGIAVSLPATVAPWAAVVRAEAVAKDAGAGDPETVYQRLRAALENLPEAVDGQLAERAAAVREVLAPKVAAAAEAAKEYRRQNAAKLVRRNLAAATDALAKAKAASEPSEKVTTILKAREYVGESRAILEAASADGGPPPEADRLLAEIKTAGEQSGAALVPALAALREQLQQAAQDDLAATLGTAAATMAAKLTATGYDLALQAASVINADEAKAVADAYATALRARGEAITSLAQQAGVPEAEVKAYGEQLKAAVDGLPDTRPPVVQQSAAAAEKALLATTGEIVRKRLATFPQSLAAAREIKGPANLLRVAEDGFSSAKEAGAEGAWFEAAAKHSQAESALEKRETAGGEAMAKARKAVDDARASFLALQQSPLAKEIQFADAASWQPVADASTKAIKHEQNIEYEDAAAAYKRAAKLLEDAIVVRRERAAIDRKLTQLSVRLQEAARLIGSPEAVRVGAVTDEVRAELNQLGGDSAGFGDVQKEQRDRLLARVDGLVAQLPKYLAAMGKADAFTKEAATALAAGNSAANSVAAAMRELQRAEELGAAGQALADLSARVHGVALKQFAKDPKVSGSQFRAAIAHAVKATDKGSRELARDLKIERELPSRLLGMKVANAVWGIGARKVAPEDAVWFEIYPAEVTVSVLRPTNPLVPELPLEMVLIPPAGPGQSPFYLAVTELQRGHYQAWRPDYEEGLDFAGVVSGLNSAEAVDFCRFLSRNLTGVENAIRLPTQGEWLQAEVFGRSDGGDLLSRSWLVKEETTRGGRLLSAWPAALAGAGVQTDAAGLYLMRGNVAELVTNGDQFVAIGGDYEASFDAVGDDGAPTVVPADERVSRLGLRLCIPMNVDGGPQ